METYILIADINFNERAAIEELQGTAFESVEQALSLIDQTPDEYYSGEKSNSFCIPIGEFCDLINDEYYDEGGNWITHIRINTL